MSPSAFVRWSWLAGWLGVLTTAPVFAVDKPNVILMVIDDLGWRDLGCYGSTFYKTPHIDRLAQEGLRFTEAYASCPVCSPTRASLMTGKYPQRFGITDWLPGRANNPSQKLLQPKLRNELPLGEITVAEVLKSAGYATAHVGKWHLGGEGFGPNQQGFDLNIAGDHFGSLPSYFAPFRNRQGKPIPNLDHVPEGEYLTDRLTSEAEAFIERHKDRPFFLYLSHYAVHTPLQAKADILKKYPNSMQLGKQSNPFYAAMIESVDESLGRIRQKLHDLKLSEKTLIIFTSDNGGLATQEGDPKTNTPATINAPLREGKGYLYEGGIRVPLLLAGPGVPSVSTNATPVCSIDLMPTILDICGGKTEAKIDGLSLAPLLKGGKLQRDALYWHYPHYANQGSRPASAIREGDWKLIEFLENGRHELYNLRQDISESRNLVLEEPQRVRDLAAKLEAWRKSVNAPMPSPNPQYLPNLQQSDGSIVLHARTADVHGVQLRYEPLPHKLTLGFWTRLQDTASWEFTVRQPGKFRVEVLQGCGNRSGGAKVDFEFAKQKLTMTVEDTGGFQIFKSRDIGTITIDQPGRHTLTVRPITKPGIAVMDLRQVTLLPVKD